jgi:hypothetical protein
VTWSSLARLGPVRRMAILHRGGMRCTWCGVELTFATAHVDHVVPRSEGGCDVNTNLVGACVRCNCGLRPEYAPAALAELLARPVDLRAGRALALTWYPAWMPARVARRPRTPPSETYEAVRKRAWRARRRAEGLRASELVPF